MVDAESAWTRKRLVTIRPNGHQSIENKELMTRNTMLFVELRQELMSIGYGSSGLDDMENERLYENVMELVTVFSKQRHSGLSAISVLYMFNKIVNDQN